MQKYQWPTEMSTGTVASLTNANSCAIVDWDSPKVSLVVDIDCLEFLGLHQNKPVFEPGDEVRMVSVYTLGGRVYQKDHPGVGSLGIIQPGYHRVDSLYGRQVSVTWHKVHNYIEESTNTHYKEEYVSKYGPMAFSELAIDDSCLQLVVPSSRDIKRALESIQNSAEGKITPARVDPEVLALFQGED